MGIYRLGNHYPLFVSKTDLSYWQIYSNEGHLLDCYRVYAQAQNNPANAYDASGCENFKGDDEKYISTVFCRFEKRKGDKG